MRFLCLHGSGTTGDILAVQLSSLQQKLGPNSPHTFDFWDGPLESKAGPGVAPFFEPPYYVWYKNATEPDIRVAVEYLLAKISEQPEPYDAVIGFSQGVSLLAATLLYCRVERPDEPLPFKGAICICGGMPALFLDKYMPVSQAAKDLVTSTNDMLSEASTRNAKKVEIMMETGKRLDLWDHPTKLWDGKETISRDPWRLPKVDERDVWGLDVSSLPEGVRLDVPVFVVYGHKDPMCPFHVQFAMLCNPEKRLVYDHRGGHEIPRTPNVVNDLASGVRWLEEKIARG